MILPIVATSVMFDLVRKRISVFDHNAIFDYYTGARPVNLAVDELLC